MEPRYRLLQTIYDIVKEDVDPLTYACKPRELILRMMEDWSTIQRWLHELESESLLLTQQQDTMVIFLTKDGVQKAHHGITQI